MEEEVPPSIAAAVAAAAAIASTAYAERAPGTDRSSSACSSRNFSPWAGNSPWFATPQFSGALSFPPNYWQQGMENASHWHQEEQQVVEEVEDEEPQFVLSEEWAELFARSEARRKQKKELQKKSARKAKSQQKSEASVQSSG